MANPIVTTQNGKLQGSVRTNRKGVNFYSFQSIPFAKPPLGNLRFKAPQPAEPWQGIRDATKDVPCCYSKNYVTNVYTGTEDCLYLNVFTPELPSSNASANPKPVLFYVFGGAFKSGSSSVVVYGPEYLLTEDIVLVTTNYRTGILGFLSLEDPELDVPGNAALKDVIMALHWVKNNIVQFSGDANNVTMFGLSAGASLIHLLTLSPLCKGLFHKAILHSGTAISFWAICERNSRQIAELLNLPTATEKELLQVIQTMPVEELYEAIDQISIFMQRYTMLLPVVEKCSKGAVISKLPIDIIKSGRYNHIPMIICYANMEGLIMEHFEKCNPHQPVNDFEKYVPDFLNLKKGSNLSKVVAKKIELFYYGENYHFSKENKHIFHELRSDHLMIREFFRCIKYHLETSKEPIYLCRFSIDCSLNLVKRAYRILDAGFVHGDETGYLFKSASSPDTFKPGSIEDIAVTRLVKLWINFAQYGNPNLKEKHPLIDVNWQPVTETQMNYLDFGENLATGTSILEAKRMAFWEHISDMVSSHKSNL